MNKKVYISIAVAIGATILLWLMPTKSAVHDAKEAAKNNVEETVTSEDLDNQVQEALDIINSGEAPMQGILKLKDVLEKDPNHLGALRQLGFFSMQTNQFEKAIERFTKIVSIEPHEAEAYYMIAQANEGLGNKEEAVKAYKLFIQNTTQSSQIEQVEKRINELSNNLKH